VGESCRPVAVRTTESSLAVPAPHTGFGERAQCAGKVRRGLLERLDTDRIAEKLLEFGQGTQLDFVPSLFHFVRRPLAGDSWGSEFASSLITSPTLPLNLPLALQARSTPVKALGNRGPTNLQVKSQMARFTKSSRRIQTGHHTLQSPVSRSQLTNPKAITQVRDNVQPALTGEESSKRIHGGPPDINSHQHGFRRHYIWRQQ
jgi:hypothetical protein